MKVIFLFSLPRSGSTLLQRILYTHNDIASTAEPWIMLPFCYSLKREGLLAEYSHGTCYEAIVDFVDNLPNGRRDCYSAIRKAILELYNKHCKNNEKYFLDKTPRYYNIIPEIAQIFPDAKFIFLFRNPVHILASIMQTWCEERFKKLYHFYRDIEIGPKKLAEGYKLLQKKAYSLRYEDFVKEPEKYTKEICSYLEIDYDPNMLSNFYKQDLKGRMGDPIGIKQYKSIEASTLNKWKKVFNTKFRKFYIRRYIQSLEEDVLKTMGYHKNEILKEIETLETSKLPTLTDLRDIIDLSYSKLVKLLKPNIWFGRNLSKWARHEFLS